MTIYVLSHDILVFISLTCSKSYDDNILGQKRNATYNSLKYFVLNESGKILRSVYVLLFLVPHIFPIDLLR